MSLKLGDCSINISCGRLHFESCFDSRATSAFAAHVNRHNAVAMLIVTYLEARLLVLSPLEQSLRDLILLDDVDVCSPTRQCIAIDGVEKGL